MNESSNKLARPTPKMKHIENGSVKDNVHIYTEKRYKIGKKGKRNDNQPTN